MNNINKRIMRYLMVLIIVTLTFNTTIVAQAASKAQKSVDTIIKKRDAEVAEGKYTYYQDEVAKLRNTLQGYAVGTGVSSDDTVTIDGTSKKISAKDQTAFKDLVDAAIKTAGDKTSVSKESTSTAGDVQKDVNEMLQNDFNVKADTKTASGALEGFKEPLGILIGILAYIVIIGMGLFTALDICYIVIPPFRSWYSDSAEGGSRVTSKTGKNGEAKLRWISDDAVYAVKVATVEDGKSPIKVYMFKRMGAYVMAAIVIFMLLTGNMQLFVNIALNIVSGIIEQLQKMAG